MLLSNSEIGTEGMSKEVNECPQTLRGDGRQRLHSDDSYWNECRWKNLINKAVVDRRLCPRCCYLESYFKHTSFSCRYNKTQGHHVQTWCHKYSTRPLRPSRLWLQVVPSVRCRQAQGCVWALLPQPGGDVEHLMCKHDVTHKTGNM